MSFFTYILASRRNGTLYTGHTDDVGRRVGDHKSGAIKGFTAKYEVKRLVWFEEHGSRDEAFRRERQIKEWKRSWKIEMIERLNPGWLDLLEET